MSKKQEPPAWVAKRKEQNAAIKREHTKDRVERAGKRPVEREIIREAKAPRRATKEQEERIERKKREANQFIPAPKRKKSDEWDAVEAGIDARRAGKYDDALGILLAWVDNHPRDSRALTELGKVYDLRGSRDEAYSCYQRAAAADTQNREAIDRMNAYLIGITVDIDDEPASRIPTGVVKRKNT